MSTVPQYVYHGSQYKFDVIIPQQADGACERESRLAIYAAETMEEAIPFALPIRWYPDTPDGKRVFECENGRVRLVYGSLDPNGIGYIYKIKADTFKKIDQWQWVSEEVCIPVEIVEIQVKDYIHMVEFSKEAAKINKELYG